MQVNCIEGFRTPFVSGYSTFLAMQSMVEFDTMGLEEPRWVYVMHAIFTIIVNIFLLNYFIAVLSESAAAFGSYRDELFLLQRLNMCLLLERRVGWLLGWIFDVFQRRHFVCKNGRIYLTHTNVDGPSTTTKQYRTTRC